MKRPLTWRSSDRLLACRRRARAIASSPAWAAVFALIAAQDAHAQPRSFPRTRGQAAAAGSADPNAAPAAPVPAPAPATPPTAGAPNAGGAGGATPSPPAPVGGPAGAAGGAAGTPGKPGAPVLLPNGKQVGDTTGLTQFENGVEFQPRSPDYKVTFSLEDADLDQLVRVIAQLTGKRFIFGGKVRNIKATVYSPQKVTVAEAYQAFLADPRDERPHGRAARALPEDRRDRGDRHAGHAALRGRAGLTRRGAVHHAHPPPRACERGRSEGRPRPLQDEGRRHHGLRPREPPHHHRHRHRTSAG